MTKHVHASTRNTRGNWPLPHDRSIERSIGLSRPAEFETEHTYLYIQLAVLLLCCSSCTTCRPVGNSVFRLGMHGKSARSYFSRAKNLNSRTVELRQPSFSQGASGADNIAPRPSAHVLARSFSACPNLKSKHYSKKKKSLLFRTES